MQHPAGESDTRNAADEHLPISPWTPTRQCSNTRRDPARSRRGQGLKFNTRQRANTVGNTPSDRCLCPALGNHPGSAAIQDLTPVAYSYGRTNTVGSCGSVSALMIRLRSATSTAILPTRNGSIVSMPHPNSGVS